MGKGERGRQKRKKGVNRDDQLKGRRRSEGDTRGHWRDSEHSLFKENKIIKNK